MKKQLIIDEKRMSSVKESSQDVSSMPNREEQLKRNLLYRMIMLFD